MYCLVYYVDYVGRMYILIRLCHACQYFQFGTMVDGDELVGGQLMELLVVCCVSYDGV